MTDILFYHLQNQPLEAVLPNLVEKSRERGWQAAIQAASEERLQALDDHLWTFRDDSFLPHGRAGAAGEADQPILIAPAPDAANGARHIALADGIWRDEALGFDRAFHFFDDATIAAARAAWKALAGRDDIARNFWKQDDGRWTKVA